MLCGGAMVNRERKIRDSEIHKCADGFLSRTENGKIEKNIL